jgi:ADP-heptose:LPS heptosyltransferase
MLFFGSKGNKPKIYNTPKKILLANGAHLGDVILSTGILRLLKNAFPDVEIGFIVGSWSIEILKDHPMVNYLHLIDHWKLNRSSYSLRRKFKIYQETRRLAKMEIESIGYDMVIDLYCYFPNNIFVCYQAGIPIRIGYTSGGFGSLLTHSLNFSGEEKSILCYQKDLIQTFFELPSDDLIYSPCLLKNSYDYNGLNDKTEKKYSIKGQYLVFHMGAGSLHREWSSINWKMLAKLFLKSNYNIALTGLGKREKYNIDFVKELAPDRFIDLCDLLHFQEFVSLIKGAELLVTTDSMAGHVAAAINTPSIVIGNGEKSPAFWRPVSDLSFFITNPVSCAPCYKSRGCKGMECILGISPMAVFEKGNALLALQRH